MGRGRGHPMCSPSPRVAWLKVTALRGRGAWGGVLARLCYSLVGVLDCSPGPIR